ncbi:MAG: 6-carboxytetrahydropterin synthase [Bryobacteraceae bacterium]
MKAADPRLPRMRIGRRYRFSAAHRLHADLLTAERNREVFGKCNNPFGHGHDYVMEVILEGEVDLATGRLVPLEMLDHFVKRVWLDQVDHRNLNLDLPEFAALVPTTENLATVAASRLAAAWPHWFAAHRARIERLRIWETPRNIVEMWIPARDGQEVEPHEAVIENRHPGS